MIGGVELFLFLLLSNLPLNLLNSLFVRKTCESSSIANDFYHCLAIIVNQVCNIQSEFLAVGLERL
jgi:hypothetical protein